MNRKLLLLFLIALLTTACRKKCPENPPTVYNRFTADEKAFVPYTGNETLKFISDQGDTAVFVGQGRATSFPISDAEADQDDRCLYKMSYYEEDVTSFVCDTAKMNISITLYKNNESSCCSNFEMKITDLSFFASLVEKPKIDSMIINGKTYFNIYQIDRDLSYTKKEGIIKFILSNQKTWSILP